MAGDPVDETSRAVVNRWQDSLVGKKSNRRARLPDAGHLADGTSVGVDNAFLIRKGAPIGAVRAVSYRTKGRFKTMVIYAPVVNDDYVTQTRTIGQII